MAQGFDFYDERAREAAAEASAATLDNVRERALRSEKAWREMADRALQMEEDRETAKRVRAERIAAEERAAAETREAARLTRAAHEG
ncbi:MAG: hypothetical protein PHE36_06250 [Novosphingobium sp.]|nr:hypothetical protein [Novosphingobium sp.]